ncbi:hypothetical protein BC833DRAFT_523632 [Globomyces pollinis-pini]|nr:hypothetical protein BC833DRAFT_523632 [Globomyces pollinis-pini]
MGTSKKPSEYIKYKQKAKFKLQASSDNKIPSVITELIPDEEKVLQHCQVAYDKPLFRPEPSNLTLQGFIPFKTYELVISFRNIDKVIIGKLIIRKIRLEPSISPYFSVQGWKRQSLQSEKVAPGMEVSFVIKFQPEENVDYLLDLICITEREKFIVPIQAIGARGILDLPDQILFSEVPVRFLSTKTLLVRNIGDTAAKFDIQVDSPFTISPNHGFLECNDSMQLSLDFYPRQTGSYNSKMVVKYSSGDEMVLDVIGSAENLLIRLDKGHLKVENTISLTTTKTFQIFNRSNHMVSFAWKKCVNEMEEEHMKAKRHLQLLKSEQDEINALGSTKTQMLDVSLLKRKYKDECLPVHYENPVFKIQPLQGSIWPGSSVEITVLFKSLMVGEHNSIAYCEVEGRESRLPLQLKGIANGPEVAFAYSHFQIGEIFINTPHEYEIMLENHGVIPTKFQLMEQKTLFGPCFSFNPSSGNILVGEQILITVTFIPEMLGTFKEEFQWELEGGTKPLVVIFEGNTIGPTFKFDVEKLHIPQACYGFSVEHGFQLENTSQIPMGYQLEILSDDPSLIDDFTLIPTSGVIDPLSSNSIILEFLPTKIQTYSLSIAVNIDNIGRNLLQLPVEAESMVPEIVLKQPMIELGDCYLDYSYVRTVEFVNDTEHWAKFTIDYKDMSRNSVYSYSFDVSTGVIEPHSIFSITLEVKLKRLGTLNFPIFVSIDGSSGSPLILDISANGIGPNVTLSSTELNWGKMNVLTNIFQTLTLNNESPIPAKFNCSTITESHVFQIDKQYGEILPGKTCDINVTAYLDDTVKFTDVLKVDIGSSKTIDVLLVAKGQGPTIVFDEGLKSIAFNEVFSNRECSTQYTMYNKGRRTQHLSWIHMSTKDPEVTANQIFEVIPNRFTLKPGSHQVIFIRAYSNTPRQITDKLICQVNSDKDPSRKVLVETHLTVTFIEPLITIDPPFLKFDSSHTTDDSFQTLEKYLTISNTTSLVLTPIFKCTGPFKINHAGVPKLLQPGVPVQISVLFNPAHNLSRISTKEQGKLHIWYKEHPQKDYVELTSEVFFPNLNFSVQSLHFGCIQNDIEQRKVFQMTNTSILPVNYNWYFIDENNGTITEELTQAFDIIPIRGIIEPGQTENVIVYFYGHRDKKFNVKALCDVSGGPKYELEIQGEASTITYAFDKTSLDFGTQSYQNIIDQEITLFNNGLVSFNYNTIIFAGSALSEKLVVIPSSGMIESKGKQKLIVRFCHMVPETIEECFYIQVAHFEPSEIKVSAKSTFPRLLFELPREEEEAFTNIYQELLKKKQKTSSVDVAYETDRLYLKDRTNAFLSTYRDELKQKETPSDPSKVKYAGSYVLFNKGFLPKSTKENKQLSMSESSSVNLGKFICDFGTIVRNSSTKKVFQITNTGFQSVSFSIQKTLISAFGFSVEPEKVKFLPPGESIGVTILFNARSEESAIDIDVPIYVQGGPTLFLNIKVNIAVPEIIVSNNELVDFGEILCGYRKSIILQIENVTPVACEWTSKTGEFDLSPKKLKKIITPELQDFDIIPPNGILQPLEKSTITLRFSPSSEKVYSTKIPIKIFMNSKFYEIETKAKGVVPALIFEPNCISAGPILPFGDGLDTKITLFNPTNHTIEFVCTDFDLHYKAEEELLKQIDGIDSEVLYIPPRDFNTPLIDHLQEHARKKTKIERKDIESPQQSESAGVGELAKPNPAIPNSSTGPGEAMITPESPVSILIHGPPFSGRTSQAKKIANIFGRTYIHLDEIVESSFHSNEPLNNDQELNSLHAGIKEESKVAEEPKMISEETMIELIKARLGKDENSKGFVIDGLECKYFLNITPIIKTLTKLFCDKGKKLIVYHILLDYFKIRERESNRQNILAENELALLRVKELSEDEYDILQQAEKDSYDIAMRKYKKRAKEIEDKRHKERRHQEEEIANRIGDRKTADESKNKNRRNLHSRLPTVEKPEKTTTKSEKTAKKPGSPKLGRKNEKSDKHNDRDRHFDKGDKDYVDDQLTEDYFINESTFKRVEMYVSSLEPMLAVLREGKELDKANVTPAKVPAPVGPPEKIDKKSKPAKATQNEVLVAPIIADVETHLLDDMVAEFHELNGNAMDEESLFKAISEFIPVVQKDDSSNLSKSVTDSYLEQVYKVTQDREKLVTQKIFTIVTYSPVEVDVETELPMNSIVPLPTKGIAVESRKNKTVVKANDEKGLLEHEEEIEKEVPTQYRWVLQGGERKDIIVRFNPTDAGKTELSLNFETIGYNAQFKLPCVGNCQHSHIVTDYRKIFPRCRKNKEDKTISHGDFIISTSTYEFGPLHHNKPREKYLERFPENRANFNITNPGLSEIKVLFSLKNDIKSDVFFFDPQAITLAPGKSQQVSLWAYPRSPTTVEDLFIISVKDNPEPFSFKVSCIGVKPEIEVDKKTLNFDKLLLGRSEKREIKLKNPTYMPVAWRFAGIDSLGEEFTITPLEGQVESFQELTVTAEFRGIKSLLIKKVLKLEVSDVEKIGGVVQEIAVVVTAEAYDIAMDIHFPKGFEGGLDFGTLKVSDDGKQLVTLKNKGKYEVGFRFIFDSNVYQELLSITPTQGIIQPSEKPFFVQVIFKTSNELYLKEASILKCIVFEPATGEVTASIPVKVSGRAVFSKFTVLPVRDLNFGALVHGAKSTKQFLIENTGEFDFRYSIFKLMARTAEHGKHRPSAKPGNNAKGRPVSPPPAMRMVNKKEIVKQTDTINFGVFSVFPTSGVVPAGTKQSITVDFHADTSGSFEETIGIDVSDRSPTEFNDAMEYQLIGESCIPGINTTDFTSIFEEQSVCKRLELFKTQTSVYGEEDRVFYYGAFLAGQQVQVHFKISNPFKVPCDVSFFTKPRGKTKSEASDFSFDVEPKKLTIPSHEHRYVAVSFHPTTIQTYSGIFEAIVENVTEGKNKYLSFEIRGEGTLPRVTVDKPTLKSKSGIALLKFRKLLVGTSQTLSIVLRNDGIISANFKLEWLSKDNDDFYCSSLNSYQSLKPQESRSIEVKCQPSSIRKLEGELKLKVIDNSFEDSSIQVMGEGYMDDLTIEGFGEDVENEMAFLDCYIGESKSMNFRLKNHSNDWLKAVFIENADFVFSPLQCHIKPKGGEREITVNFCPKQPVDIQHISNVIKVSKLKFAQPPEFDWDDRMKIVRWVNVEQPGMKIPLSKKVIEQLPEPAYDVLSSSSDYHILLTAFSDYSSYECDVNNIHFKSTMMYQNRVYRFPIRNIGKVSLRFAFEIFSDESFSNESIDCPFYITPTSGKIAPGEVVMAVVRFSPTDVGEYKNFIQCKISNLSKDQKPLQIQVDGYSLRPFCHFELEDTDPMAVENRTPERSLMNGVPVVLEPNTKIIEFKSCGIRVKNIKKFYIVNPTQNNYEFMWKLESSGESKSCFKCLTPKGLVASNKKSEISFEFMSDSLDTKESLWSFLLPEHGIKIPFLLIGYALEPNVYMNVAGVNFKSVLVGRHVKEVVKLVNDELMPFNFNFNETSVEMGNEGVPVLKFHPLSGIVPPQSEVPIDISFIPPSEKMYNFNLTCNIRKKPTPVTINVKGEGYEIHDSLHMELVDGSMLQLVSGGTAENSIDFGIVQINEKRIKKVHIINSGKFNFDFSWKISKRGPVTVNPEIGTVLKGERLQCEIIFIPSTTMVLKDLKLQCQILNGQTFPISVFGTGSKPLVKISPSSIDFGTQFIHRHGMTPASFALEITNNDVTEMIFDILTSEVPWLELDRGLYTLAPGESKTVNAIFYPKDSIIYNETIKFEINGLSIVEIPVCGEGSEFKVEAETSSVNFGALRIGNNMMRSVKIVNKSKITTSFNIGPTNTISHLQNFGLSFLHSNEIILRPKASLSLDIKFHPHKRIPAFSEEIAIEFHGNSKPLFMVTGACQGTEVRLENDTLPFGAVVQKSFTIRRLQIQNTGDIGARFIWDESKFAPDFSISPSEGYISPGMEIPLEITFHPTELNPDIRAENLQCKIEGTSSLYLTLSGMCIPQPNQSDVIKFSTPVRTPEVKSIPISNKTSNTWHIRPIIENSYWSGPELLDIESGQSKSYDLTFNPLESVGSGEGGRHEGSIFFPLPDGTGILYRLNGAADKVLPMGNINREMPCKTLFTEILPITNWLRRTQRFKVLFEFAKPESSIIVKGHEFIDVSPSLTKDYKFTFYAYKEGVCNLKVTFKNEQTQEYSFYNLTYKSLPPGVISVIEITSPIRQLQTREVIISNPLTTPASFSGSSNNVEVTVPNSFTIQPKSEAAFPIEFLPLQPKESTARIIMNSPDLGIYIYDVKLNSIPSGLERSLHFKVGLGSQQTQTFRFISYAKAKTDYTCKIESSEFSVEKSVSAPAASSGGVEVSVDVLYEPSRLGDVRTQLLVSSPNGGDYVCPLFGHCVSPKPQGPIIIKPGSISSVSFKNVFSTSATFNCVVDNPAFVIKAAETIAPKKTISLTIGYKQPGTTEKEKGAANTNAAVAQPKNTNLSKTGKLTITNANTNIAWMYYLKFSS